MTVARIFVAVVFLILGASFIASTGVLINEFWGNDWLTMVVAHSHLFFFFPVFGILALVAFYLPSVVFTHLYWTHLPSGKLRFLLGLAAITPSRAAAGSPPANTPPDAEMLLDLDLLKDANLATEGDLLKQMPLIERLRLLENLNVLESPVPTVPAREEAKPQ